LFDDKTILLAEDNTSHVELIRHAFKDAGLPYPIQVVSDGEQAIAYLKGEGRYSDRHNYPYPALLLLDLKMPRTLGFEVLAWARRQPEHKTLPIVVLTNSSDIKDLNRAYELGANSFLVKPLNIQDLKNLIQALHGFLHVEAGAVKPPRIIVR
jgi:CheY-like chemotaxis protein